MEHKVYFDGNKKCIALYVNSIISYNHYNTMIQLATLFNEIALKKNSYSVKNIIFFRVFIGW